MLPSWFSEPHLPTLGSFFADHAKALASVGCRIGVIYPHAVSLKKPSRYRIGQQKHYLTSEIPVLNRRYLTWPKLKHHNIDKRVKQFGILYTQYQTLYGTPDVILAQSCAGGPAGAAGVAANALHQRTGIPFVVFEHSSAFLRGIEDKWEEHYITSSFANAASVCAVSSYLREALIDFGVRQDIDVIGNIIDPEVFKPVYDAETDNRSYHFATVAYLRQIKRTDLVIRAAALLKAQGHRFHLSIIGDGEQRKQLERLTRQLTLDNEVSFTGELSRRQVADILRYSDCYLLSSEIETFSVTTHESLACGLDVIATNCGGPVPLLRQLNMPILDALTPEILAHAMLRQIQHSAKTSAQKQQQHRVISARYAPVIVGEKLKTWLTGSLQRRK